MSDGKKPIPDSVGGHGDLITKKMGTRKQDEAQGPSAVPSAQSLRPGAQNTESRFKGTEPGRRERRCRHQVRSCDHQLLGLAIHGLAPHAHGHRRVPCPRAGRCGLKGSRRPCSGITCPKSQLPAHEWSSLRNVRGHSKGSASLVTAGGAKRHRTACPRRLPAEPRLRAVTSSVR